MKQLVVLAGCCVFLFGPAGCQNISRGDRGVEVIIEGDGKFPETLAGKWRANKGFWEFVFEPDGRISSAVIALGRVKIIPGQITRFATRYGKGVFEPGLWSVWYSPENRELGVTVVIEHFYQDVGKGAIEGNTTEILVGSISEDIYVWEPDWFSFGRYVVLMPEPNECFHVSEPEFVASLIFEKVQQEK